MRNRDQQLAFKAKSSTRMSTRRHNTQHTTHNTQHTHTCTLTQAQVQVEAPEFWDYVWRAGSTPDAGELEQ